MARFGEQCIDEPTRKGGERRRGGSMHGALSYKAHTQTAIGPTFIQAHRLQLFW